MVYAVVQQESGKVQRLVTAKSRLAKTNLTIPRLELVAWHMAVNLAVNVRNALKGFKMAENIQIGYQIGYQMKAGGLLSS